ncbi:4771_t:CDS:2, partial [Acaulospora colombiana]
MSISHIEHLNRQNVSRRVQRRFGFIFVAFHDLLKRGGDLQGEVKSPNWLTDAVWDLDFSSGLSDIQATPTNSNTSQTDLSSHVKPNDEVAKAPAADEDDEDEEFIYPGSREETQPEPPQETPETPASTSV